jgi:hypothetical protein
MIDAFIANTIAGYASGELLYVVHVPENAKPHFLVGRLPKGGETEGEIHRGQISFDFYFVQNLTTGDILKNTFSFRQFCQFQTCRLRGDFKRIGIMPLPASAPVDLEPAEPSATESPRPQ